MAVSPARAADVLAKCARHCCICRRFRSLLLQVHHIVEQADGGTDELDNLIAICVSCHANVHAETKLTRRFTNKELKLHRDNVYQLVEAGKLPTSEEGPDRLAILSASVVEAVLARGTTTPDMRPQLPALAVEILLAAVQGNGEIKLMPFQQNMLVYAGGRTFGAHFDRRLSARIKDAIGKLQVAGLIRGDSEMLHVEDAGFLFADDVLTAAASNKPEL